jgi:hypothetical protein
MSLVLLLYLAFGSSLLVMRLRGRHALFPPRGEQEKGEKRVLLRHSRLSVAPAREAVGSSRHTQAEAETMMRWAYSLAPALPYYIGGYFWWYGYQDVLKGKARLAGTFDEALTDEAAALGP